MRFAIQFGGSGASNWRQSPRRTKAQPCWYSMGVMPDLSLRENCLGFELHGGERLVALYRAREELPRSESPKPCFAPIHTRSGVLITEYRPADHLWHTGLYFGWVHANATNLWGGPWYDPQQGQYEHVEHSHGVQRHVRFSGKQVAADGASIAERLEWLDADEQPMAEEQREYVFEVLANGAGYFWTIEARIAAVGEKLVLGASRAGRYSGLELRMGPPFAPARHRSSEGHVGHESIMGQRARWVSAAGAGGGAVVMLDHPHNPRHPVTWFTRVNLLGAGLLMEGDLELDRQQPLRLRYGFAILDQEPHLEEIEALYRWYCRR